MMCIHVKSNIFFLNELASFILSLQRFWTLKTLCWISNFIEISIATQSFSESYNGSVHKEKSARLYHIYDKCEWYLGSLDQTEMIFDHGFRATYGEISGSETRSLLFLSTSRFLWYARKDSRLNQHSVILALTENTNQSQIGFFGQK